MKLGVFLELVEFKAKTASVFPFILGLCYSWYHGRHFHGLYVLVFFFAMLLFNMAVDMLDNYHDYHHASAAHDYKEKVNIIGREGIDPKLVFRLMWGMIILSAACGLWLVSQTGLPLLYLGMICFLIGYCYSSGPRPLSSLPVGEVASGITMGFLIPLICVYLNQYEDFPWTLTNVGGLFLAVLPLVLWIANLMLANNTCDLTEDRLNHRYTLVHYIGQKGGVRLFVSLNMLAFAAILLSVILKLVPVTTLATLVVLPLVIRETIKFCHKQVKTETFSCAVTILASCSLVYAISFAAGALLFSQ